MSPVATSKPRVLQVITKLDVGGAEVVALGIMSALHEHVDFAVATVIDPRNPSPVGRDMRARLAALRVPIFPGAKGHFKTGGVVRSALKLARAVARFKPEVVHLHTEMPELTWAVAGLLSRQVRQVTVLRTVHNCELWIAWGGIGRWVTQRLAGSRTVAVSHAAANADAAIKTRTRRPLARVIYNGVPAPAIDKHESAVDGVGPCRVLFAGRFIEQKAPDLLPAILVAAHRQTHRRDVQVTLAGTGPMEAGLRAAITGLAPGWRVEITPPIERLQSRLAEYDVVIMPSRYEGFGLLALETLLAGVPLIATHAPGLAEVLPDGYVFSAPVDDAESLGRLLAQVIEDPTAARALVRGGRDPLARRFSPQAMVLGYALEYGLALSAKDFE
ncbi:group 1 glycosyl transferase [Novosphingobium sp. Rr 2-17]|nr:group 1 glycosyl transferase [Novosphingobium sp. Rr 2-17]